VPPTLTHHSQFTTTNCSVTGNQRLCTILPSTAQGVPVLLYQYEHFKPSKFEATPRANAVHDIAMIERALSLTPPDGPNRVIIVHDISHLSARDINIKYGMLISKYCRILIPERVEAIVIFPAPFFLRGLLAMFRPVMGTDFSQRMKVLAGKKAANKFLLSKGMTSAQLPTSLGGDREVLWPRDESEIVLASEIDNPKEQLCETINKGVDAAVQEPIEEATKVGVHDVVEGATQEQERITADNALTETVAA
jgi:hypothetical protein